MSLVAPKQLSADSASDGQVLTYDSSTSTWGPESASGGGKMYFTIVACGSGCSNAEYLDLVEDDEASMYGWVDNQTVNYKHQYCIPFACKLAYSSSILKSGGGAGSPEKIQVKKNGTNHHSILLSSVNQATDHTSSNITFAAGDVVEVRCATSGESGNWSSLEYVTIRLIFESTAGGGGGGGISAAEAITAVEGESTLALSGAVSMAGKVTFNRVTKTTANTPYTVAATDYIIGCNTSGGVLELDLPAAETGRVLIIKDEGGAAGTSNITIDPSGSEQIDSAGAGTPLVISTNKQSFSLYGVTGTGWFIY